MSVLLSLLVLSLVLGVSNAQGPTVIIWAAANALFEGAAAEPGTGWGRAQLIEAPDARLDFGPQVAVDPQGAAVAVWHHWEGPGYDLWANRFVPDVGWGLAELLETDDAGLALDPQIAVDPQGNAIAVWQQRDHTRLFDIWANRFVPGVGWGTAEVIETNASSTSHPQVAVDPQGNAVAVWGQSTSIWSNRFVPGVGWGTAEVIETNASSTSNPQIAFDRQGNAIAVWSQGGETSLSDIWANRFVPGVGWGTAEVIETDLGYARHPQVAVDPQGNAVAVWHQDDGTSRFNIRGNRFVPDVGWGTAELIEIDDAGDALSAQVALDPEGNATAVWRQSDGTRDNIWANRFAEEIVSPGLAISPFVVAAGIGVGVVAVAAVAAFLILRSRGKRRGEGGE